MKKIISLLLVTVLAISATACSQNPPAPSQPAESEAAQTEPATEESGEAADVQSEDGKFELALITDIGTIDDKSFNQGSWEGLSQYAVENGNKSHKYYKPAEKSTDAYVSTIDLAVEGGAKLIVCPGFLFEEAIFIAQDAHPDVKFVLLDGTPHNEDYSEFRIEQNVYSVFYAEEQAGYLAGYAAVKDGNKSLGFMGGMAVPAVVRFGYGYIQGADAAAKELGLTEVPMYYNYTGGFSATPEAQTLAASWYQNGTDVIFGCGGAVGNSVMAAAEQAGKKVIGVDVDQSPESQTVITSAMKGLGSSVYQAVESYYRGDFEGGKSVIFDASNAGIALPMETSKFETFSQEDYDAIYNKLSAGEIKIVKDVDDNGNTVNITDIPTSVVKVIFVE